jgi:hypothetical protein
MSTSDDLRERLSTIRRGALVTLGAVGLAFMALDDITTDRSTGNFLPERILLAACAAWFAFVGARLIRERHRILGGLSLGVLALGAAVQPGVGPGLAPMWFKYVAYGATLGALGWFVVLAGLMTWSAWRGKPLSIEESTS